MWQSERNKREAHVSMRERWGPGKGRSCSPQLEVRMKPKVWSACSPMVKPGSLVIQLILEKQESPQRIALLQGKTVAPGISPKRSVAGYTR